MGFKTLSLFSIYYLIFLCLFNVRLKLHYFHKLDYIKFN